MTQGAVDMSTADAGAAPIGLGLYASMTVRPVADGEDCSDAVAEQRRYLDCLDFWELWRAEGSRTSGGSPMVSGGDHPDGCAGRNQPAPPEQWAFSVVFPAADAVALERGESLEIDVGVRDGVTATIRIIGR